MTSARRQLIGWMTAWAVCWHALVGCAGHHVHRADVGGCCGPKVNGSQLDEATADHCRVAHLHRHACHHHRQAQSEPHGRIARRCSSSADPLHARETANDGRLASSGRPLPLVPEPLPGDCCEPRCSLVAPKLDMRACLPGPTGQGSLVPDCPASSGAGGVALLAHGTSAEFHRPPPVDTGGLRRHLFFLNLRC